MMFTLSTVLKSLRHFVSEWTVCFLQNLQYFFISDDRGHSFLFFMVL